MLTYRYPTNMRIKNDDNYSLYYIVYGICSTILVLAFYIITFEINDPVRLSIVQAGLSAAILLKIGIFPIYNYLSDGKYKKNLQYSILQFCFIPYIGTIAYIKLLDNMNLLDEAYQISQSAVLMFALFCFAICAIKSKNIVKILANIGYCISATAIINCLFLNDINISLKLISLSTFCLLGVYSLLCVLKINLRVDKINIALLRGIFADNRFFAFLLSLQLLFLCAIIPNGITLYGIKALYNIYLFDKVGIYLICAIIFAFVLVIFSVLNIIQNIYNLNKKEPKKPLTKATALNYTVAFVTIIFLIVNMFL